MTAVVLARTYAEAYDAAMLLGLGQSWVYPHDPVLLNGLQVSRVVYVEGWTGSSSITTEAMQMLTARTTSATPVTTLDLTAPPAPSVPLSAPSGAPGVQEYRTEPAPRQAARRRRRVPPVLILLAGGLVGSAVSVVGDMLGWW